MFRLEKAVKSEPEATVHPQVAIENSRALWRAADPCPHRADPGIATPGWMCTGVF